MTTSIKRLRFRGIVKKKLPKEWKIAILTLNLTFASIAIIFGLVYGNIFIGFLWGVAIMPLLLSIAFFVTAEKTEKQRLQDILIYVQAVYFLH